MDISTEQIRASQAPYSKPMLALYDFIVHWFSSNFLWKCPAHHILELYDQHVSDNHLDVGVGTGYFLDRCTFPSAHPRLGLMDLNPNCLEVTARKLIRYKPEVYRTNVLEPIKLEVPKFDTIGLSHLLHCLPGTIHTKKVALEHLKMLLNPGGSVFGATILAGGDVELNRLARRALALYNAKGFMTNLEDDLVGFREVLGHTFSENAVRMVGCVALFHGRA